VALGFVGNYAPCGLPPQTDGMPVILKRDVLTLNQHVFLFQFTPDRFRLRFRQAPAGFILHD
ncbi:MAG: hypothetical protein K2O16_04990, partial [Lachnospiraceae bacterium]|nr:hypothetical protein [Lachnospiraceae bacterium]